MTRGTNEGMRAITLECLLLYAKNFRDLHGQYPTQKLLAGRFNLSERTVGKLFKNINYPPRP